MTTHNMLLATKYLHMVHLLKYLLFQYYNHISLTVLCRVCNFINLFPTELTDNNVEEDSNAAATITVAVQDMTLPASFDADDPTQSV